VPDLLLQHFERAISDVAAHGDNDTLPFDIDNRFIAENQAALAQLAFAYSQTLQGLDEQATRNAINGLHIFCERLLSPAGAAGFRTTTKIHPFWNIYFNGLGVAVAELHEPSRSDRAHSYRFSRTGPGLFDREASWRVFREATLVDCDEAGDEAVIVQTDIASFYEHAYHHRIQNFVADLFPAGSNVPVQIDRILNKFSSGRSFGLPVGGQGSRILAELLLSAIDRTLTDTQLVWRRYVDDYVLVTGDQAQAYRALAVLSNALSDYGLTLNKTKTTFLRSKHYVDYVRTQLGGSNDDDADKLREIDLYFDPYSDTADDDYDELKETVQNLGIRSLLDLELQKGQPDAFVVAQIGRTLKLHTPEIALQLCETLLAPTNLHAFRASWATIMRGVANVRSDDDFIEIFDGLDILLDAIPEHSQHLLVAEASCLHYLRTIRFRRTERRAQFVLARYTSSASITLRRACIDCWRQWADRPSFIRLRNQWNALSVEEQRMLWLAASKFGDDGTNFRAQVRRALTQTWSLGIESQNDPTFRSIFVEWSANVP
jgi:hypothetical protein